VRRLLAALGLAPEPPPGRPPRRLTRDSIAPTTGAAVPVCSWKPVSRARSLTSPEG
jgi:hypothetical protein